jgi:hypothetical protein
MTTQWDSSFSTSQLDELLIYLKNRDEKRMMSRDYMLGVKVRLDEIYAVSSSSVYYRVYWVSIHRLQQDLTPTAWNIIV